MKKEEFIERYSEAAYEKRLQQARDRYVEHREEENARDKEWYAGHREEEIARSLKWQKANPDKVKAIHQEANRKGGKYYEKRLEYNRTGLQGERRDIRNKHNILYRDIKQAAPNSVFHHEWIPGTANYRGVALVDKELHQRGIINVIKILEGKITLFREREIKEQGSNRGSKGRLARE